MGSAARSSSSDASAEHRDEEGLESSCGQEAQASGAVGADGTAEAAGKGGLKGVGQVDLAQCQGIQTPEIAAVHVTEARSLGGPLTALLNGILGSSTQSIVACATMPQHMRGDMPKARLFGAERDEALVRS